nr:Retrovirus-related Pol polyprotein from transposon TNT 1-94 [Ipomoea batatas]
MSIGAGEQRDGLYYFRKVSRAKAFKTEVVDSLDLLHKRSGHPSMRSTKLIPMVSSSEGSLQLNKACDVCQRAKQTRAAFPLSDNKASSAFELRH